MDRPKAIIHRDRSSPSLYSESASISFIPLSLITRSHRTNIGSSQRKAIDSKSSKKGLFGLAKTLCANNALASHGSLSNGVEYLISNLFLTEVVQHTITLSLREKRAGVSFTRVVKCYHNVVQPHTFLAAVRLEPRRGWAG